MKQIIFLFWLFFYGMPLGQCASKTNNVLLEDLPAFKINNLKYVGAFRLPVGNAGDSRMAYSQGTFTLSSDSQSIYVIGHEHHQAIGQLSVPKILDYKDITDLEMSEVLQPFTKILGRAKTGNKQGIDKITGLDYVSGQLIVNAVEYYDADANANDTTLIIRDPSNLSKSKVDGFFKLQGRSHAAGWVSSVPKEWQSSLGTELISGFASNYAINSRNSIGPTAYAFFPMALLDSDLHNGMILTEQFLGYSMEHPLHEDRYNQSGSNNLWTEISTAIYGFIVPGTSTYLVIGNSGGHKSGIGYKITQDKGHLCGGPCSKKQNDNYNYYWTWDVKDLLKVKNGQFKPYQILPKEFGKFDGKRSGWKLIGADYDSTDGLLYVMYAGKDRKQSKYEGAPIMLVYKIDSKPVRD